MSQPKPVLVSVPKVKKVYPKKQIVYVKRSATPQPITSTVVRKSYIPSSTTYTTPVQPLASTVVRTN